MANKLFRPSASITLREQDCAAGTMLTGRRRQILGLVKEGLSNKPIAQRLSLGPLTAKNHVQGLFGPPASGPPI
jgi:DNA-binding NarL/FixJ family response regulator